MSSLFNSERMPSSKEDRPCDGPETADAAGCFRVTDIMRWSKGLCIDNSAWQANGSLEFSPRSTQAAVAEGEMEEGAAAMQGMEAAETERLEAVAETESSHPC